MWAIEIIIFIFAWILTTLVVVIVSVALFHRYDFMFSFVLASLGAYIRWHLSPLNSVFNNFPLGTFIVNVTGTWVLATAFVLNHHYKEQTGLKVKGLFYGITTGLCGCLTTVSTLVVELSTLPLLVSYVYGLSSVLAAQTGLLLIRGVYWWTM